MQLPSKNDLFSVYQQVSSKVKQYAKNLSPIELKVEEATSNEPWGPHGTAMAGESGHLSVDTGPRLVSACFNALCNLCGAANWKEGGLLRSWCP